MLGSNRRTILAALGVGLLLIVASVVVYLGYQQLNDTTERERSNYSYQPARDSVQPQPRVGAHPKAPSYQPGCDKPYDREDSDLCAQWSAVEAVAESNRLTRINILIAYILGALGIVATLAGAGLVYRSLRQTERALAYAKSANELAKAEQRPWLDWDVEATRAILSGAGLECSMRVAPKNLGQQVALNVDAMAWIINYEDGNRSEQIAQFFDQDRPRAHDAPKAVFPGVGTPFLVPFDFPREEWKPEQLAEAKSAHISPIIAIDCRYWWGDGEGQTAKTFLVVRASDEPDLAHVIWTDTPNGSLRLTLVEVRPSKIR